MEGGGVTDGIRANIRVALAYMDPWLRGVAAAAISRDAWDLLDHLVLDEDPPTS